MKKILTALAASAFALTLYATPATACPGHDKSVTTKKDKKDGEKAADKKQDKKQDKKKSDKPASKKVS